MVLCNDHFAHSFYVRLRYIDGGYKLASFLALRFTIVRRNVTIKFNNLSKLFSMFQCI